MDKPKLSADVCKIMPTLKDVSIKEGNQFITLINAPTPEEQDIKLIKLRAKDGEVEFSPEALLERVANFAEGLKDDDKTAEPR